MNGYESFWNEDGSDVWDFNNIIFSEDIFADLENDQKETFEKCANENKQNADKTKIVIKLDTQFLRCNEKIPSSKVTVFPKRYLGHGEYIEIYEPDKSSFLHDTSTIYAMLNEPSPFNGEQLKTQKWLCWRDYKTQKCENTLVHVFRLKNHCQPGKPRLRLSLIKKYDNWFRYIVSMVNPKEIILVKKKRKIDFK